MNTPHDHLEAPDAEHLVEVQKRRFDLMIRGDCGELAKMLCDDLRYVHSRGKLDTKTQFLAKLAAEPGRYVHIHVLEQTQRIIDSVGLINGVVDLTLAVQGCQSASRIRFTEISRWERGAWRMLAWQSTLLLDMS